MILVLIRLLVIIPSSMMCLMPYACQLASCSMGISNYTSCPDSMTLHSPCPLFSSPLSPFSGFCSPFYSGCFLVEPWDSLSDYVYPGIACLAFQASDWVGAFWGSLSGFLINHFLSGVHPSMTLVKLIMIGYHCNHLDGWLNCFNFSFYTLANHYLSRVNCVLVNVP